jgi:HD-like signal output (HDOD) protein
MEGEIRQLVRDYVDQMPPLPASVTKVLQLCRDPKTSPHDLNRVISFDPVLLGRVMNLINSAYYGFHQEITSLVRAIIMLGINTIKNLALSTAILSTFSGSKGAAQSPLDMDGFWRHCLAVGVAAKLMAKIRGVDPKELEQFFICGLLHDIGKIPVNNRLGAHYLRALKKSEEEQISLNQAEIQLFGNDHQYFGDQVLSVWDLGTEISDCVSYHHLPEEYTGNHSNLVATVAVADYFCNIMEIGFGGNRRPKKPSEAVFIQLGLSWLQLEELEEDVRSELEKAQIFLKL